MAYSPKPLVPPAAIAIVLLGGAAVLGLGFWAYEVEHATIAALL